MLSFTIGKSSITVFIDGSIHTVDSSHANFQPLLDELRKPPAERDRGAIKTYSTIRQFITRYEGGRIRITDAEVLFDEVAVSNYMTQRMLDIVAQGIDIEPWALFMDKVMDNPADYARAELYQWLEAGQMPICPDGDFIAFKKVRANYTDVFSGLFDNSPGTILEMDREACDPDRDRTCSTGFHFCSAGYLSQYPGERVVVVKVNPSNVTAIPSDYKFTKGRTCRYEVVAELSSESAARYGVWRQPVAYLEDVAEFPREVITNLTKAGTSIAERREVPFIHVDGAALRAGEGVKLKATMVTHPDDDREQSVADQEQAVSIKRPAVIAAYHDPEDDEPFIPLSRARKISAAATAEPKSKGPLFVTSDGREFSVKKVKSAIAKATSQRDAARSLGIGESTLRGWIKRL